MRSIPVYKFKNVTDSTTVFVSLENLRTLLVEDILIVTIFTSRPK